MLLFAGLRGPQTTVAILYNEQFADKSFIREVGSVFESAIQYVIEAESSKSSLKGAFFKSLLGTEETATKSFWNRQFSDLRAIHFPAVSDISHESQVTESVSISSSEICGSLEISSHIVTSIIASWALLMEQYTGGSDTVFGYVGPQQHLGLRTSPIPLRVDSEEVKTVQELLQLVDSQMNQTTEFGTFGLHRIRQMSNEAEHACKFRTVLQISSSESSKSATFSHAYPLILHFYVSDDCLRLVANFDSQVMNRSQVQNLVGQTMHILGQISKSESLLNLRKINTVPQTDLHHIWRENMKVPKTADANVCTLISRTSHHIPEDIAISSWDGQFTYSELDTISTKLADGLRSQGISSGAIVPLCFEKSRWAVIAVLGVLKVGGTVLLQSSSVSVKRRQEIHSRVNASLCLVSDKKLSVDQDIIPTFTVSDLLHDNAVKKNRPIIPKDPMKEPAIILFTSGSTGEPKGIVWSNSTLTANVMAFGSTAGLGQHSRVFQFVSYDFDVSIVETFATLICGGCICIPSETQRLEQLSETVANSESNLLCITPTAGASLTPGKIPKLATIIFAGESLKQSDVDRFPDAHIVNWYGPAEASFASSCSVNNTPWQDGNIGSPLVSVSWIANPNNDQELVPLGGIGELLIEGPIVALGYYNNSNLTAASFIEDPTWLLQGAPDAGIQGRPGRLFKTGDLVRREVDGSLIYMGRKDAQVKIRGQRVELDEVAHNLLKIFPKDHGIKVAPEVVTPTFSGVPLLVAFVSMSVKSQQADTMLSQLQGMAEDHLTDMLPSYMMPSAYVLIGEIPITNTGKVDRRRLREWGAALTATDISQRSSGQEDNRNLTHAEKQLKNLWASVLGTTAGDIHVDDSFMLIGGDSILAMKLVGKAHENGLSLTVTDVLRRPRLCDMALSLRQSQPTSSSMAVEPPQSNSQTKDTISMLLELDSSNIRETTSVTDFQTICIDGNLQAPRKWWANLLIYYSSENILPEQLVARCLQLWEAFDILRSIFVQANGQLWQVSTQNTHPKIDILQVKGQLKFHLDKIAEDEESKEYKLGTPPTSFTVMQNEEGQVGLRVGLSHAQYDGICLPQIMQFLEDLDGAPAVHKPTPFSAFIHHAAEKQNVGKTYWTRLLKGSTSTHIPRHVKPFSISNVNGSLNGHTNGNHTRHVNGTQEAVALKVLSQIPRSEGSVSAASVFSTACALALSKATGESDITFGRVVSGRSSLPPSLQDVFGPCINFVPLRIQVDKEVSHEQTLHSVHDQYINSLPYETVGFKEIIADCTDWNDDYFGCTVQYQNIANPTGTMTGAKANADFWRHGRIGIGGNWLEIFAMPVDNELEITVLSKVHDRDMLQQILDDIVSFVGKLL
jgi:amino acid adenylation domain-containing protein